MKDKAMKLALSCIKSSAEYKRGNATFVETAEDIEQALAAPVQPVQERCEYCDGTGDVHDQTGEWRGVCNCEAGKRLAAPVQEPVGEVCGYYERGFDAEKTRYGKLYNQELPIGTKLYTTPPAQEIVCSTGLCHYKPAAQPAPVQPLTWLKTIETQGGFGKFVEAKPNEKGAKPVYTTPPAAQRPWVGLTDERVRQLCGSVPSMKAAVREAEVELKEKNT